MVHRRVVEPHVIVMRADRHVLASQRGIAPGQDGDDVARGGRRFGEAKRPLHGLPGGAGLQPLERRAEQALRDGRGDVHVRRHHDGVGRLGSVVQRVLWFAEERPQPRRHRVEARDRDAGGGAIAPEQRPPVHLRAGREIRPEADPDHDELPGGLVGREYRAVPQGSGKDDLRTVERLGGTPRIARDVVVPGPERRAVHDDARVRVELTLHEWDVLEESPRVAPRLQSHAPHFRGHVRRRLEVVFRPRGAAHHGIVGVEVQTGHQVGGRNRGLRGCGRMLQRQGRLGPRRLRGGEQRAERCNANGKLHGTASKGV